MNSNFLKFYKVMIWAILVVFFGLFLVYFVNSFYTHEQTRINESMVSDLAWDLSNIKLRQLRVLEENNTYVVKNELLVSNVKLNIHTIDDLPITLMDKTRRIEKAKYYTDFNILISPVSLNQVDALKLRFGLMKCAYILILLFIVWQVRKMLVAVEKENYFKGKAVGNCLGWISVIFVLIPIFNLIFNFHLEIYLTNLSSIENFKFKHDFNFSIWLGVAASAFCAIIGAIVSKGVKIKEEQDLTI